MSTLKSLSRWFLPLLGVYFILIGIGMLFNLVIPVIVLGLLAVFVGVLALLAS